MALYAALLLLTLIIGLWRVLRDRGGSIGCWSCSFRYFRHRTAAGTGAVAGAPALRDAALVLALLAAMVSAALVQLLRRSRHE